MHIKESKDIIKIKNYVLEKIKSNQLFNSDLKEQNHSIFREFKYLIIDNFNAFKIEEKIKIMCWFLKQKKYNLNIWRLMNQELNEIIKCI